MTEVAATTDDRVDMIGPARLLWARRTPILFVAVVCAIIGFATGFYFIKTRADSFLQLSYTAPVTAPDEKQDKEGKDLRFRINVAEYKVLTAAIFSRESFLDYASKTGSLDPSTIASLGADLAKDNQLARWVKPVFALARADLRDIPDQQRDEANYLVGLEFSVERRSPDEALAIVKALGNFARDSAIILRAREFVTGLFYKASSRLLDVDRAMITMRLQLAQAEGRQKELEGIRTRYPEALRGDVRQVISVDAKTSRFLPPTTQLVGTESQITELHETLKTSEWDQERSKALIAFLDPAQQIIRDARSGDAMFAALDKLMAATFDPAHLASDPWRDAFNTLKIEIFGLKTLYFERMRFVASPALNSVPLWIRLLPALAGFLAGVVLAATTILLRDRFAR